MKNKVILCLVFFFIVILIWSNITNKVEINNTHPDHNHTSGHVIENIINLGHDIENVKNTLLEQGLHSIQTWAKTLVSDTVRALVTRPGQNETVPKPLTLPEFVKYAMRRDNVTSASDWMSKLMHRGNQTKEGMLKRINTTVNSVKNQLKTFDWFFENALSTLKKRGDVDKMYKKLREKDKPPETFLNTVKPLLKVCNQLKREIVFMNAYIKNYEKLQQIKEKYGVNDSVMNLTISQNITAIKKQLPAVLNKVNEVEKKIIDYGNAYNLSSSNMIYLINEINGFNSSKYHPEEIGHVENLLKSCDFKSVNNVESSDNKTI